MAYQVQINHFAPISLTDGQLEDMDYVQQGKDRFHFLFNNIGYRVDVVTIDARKKRMTLIINEIKYTLHIKDEVDILLDQLGFSKKRIRNIDKVESPMPGLILEVDVKPGDEVEEGQRLLVLEAMKMENIIKSPVPGKIKEVLVNTGENIDSGQILIKFEKE